MGLNQAVRGQGMARPPVPSSQAPGSGCAAVLMPAGHRRNQPVNHQVCASLTGVKALAAESSQLLLPERRR